jgi:hypothetical protein
MDIVKQYKTIESELNRFNREGLDSGVRDAFHALFKTTGWFSDTVDDATILGLLKAALKSFGTTATLSKSSLELECELCALKMRSNQPKKILDFNAHGGEVFLLLGSLVSAVKKDDDDREQACLRCKRR